MNKDNPFKLLRRRIDRLDHRILDLLNQRTRLAITIGRLKRQHGLGVYVPHRETTVLRKLLGSNRGPLKPRAVEAIFREIMSGSLAVEKELTIAYLGPEATFTHLAAMKKFGDSVKYYPCRAISDIFTEIERERCEYGVVPIENSIEGAVNHTLDMFVDSPLKICSEVLLEISHHLLSREKSLARVRRVYSNPQVFGQCRQWLETHLKHAALMECSSTSEAARRAARERGVGAIASELAGKIYGLKPLASSIEDSAHNWTRFLVIGRQSSGRTRLDKTSILFSITDRVGALQRMLYPFRKYRINLTKIESRPSKRKAWDYYFFVDLEGHVEEPRVRKALKSLERSCRYLKVLGSYPQARS
ncbi:MAG: prephenate dehydratase [Candidatus Omnitrophica bacterium]|nr:prephenate dehydratase [Candidatus Omnitrophota bacterium]